MAHAPRLTLVDPHGVPFDPRIEEVVVALSARAQRQFPALRDELLLTEVLEETARRIAQRERHAGPLEHRHGYAWVTLRSVAVSYLRRGPSRLAGRTLGRKHSESVLSTVSASAHTAAHIERAVLHREVLALLSAGERELIELQEAGFSSADIASAKGRSIASVNTACSRAKARLRRIIGATPLGGSGNNRPRRGTPAAHELRAGRDSRVVTSRRELPTGSLGRTRSGHRAS